MTAQEIDRRINELEYELENPKPFPAEVYTRIVGYYRSVANWNAGKREEYKHRREYEEEQSETATRLAKPSTTNGKAAEYLLFTQPACPQCPSMKAKVATMSIPGLEVDASTEDGFQSAADWNVTSTPTLILLDDRGSEATRIMTVGDWPLLWNWL